MVTGIQMCRSVEMDLLPYLFVYSYTAEIHSTGHFSHRQLARELVQRPNHKRVTLIFTIYLPLTDSYDLIGRQIWKERGLSRTGTKGREKGGSLTGYLSSNSLPSAKSLGIPTLPPYRVHSYATDVLRKPILCHNDQGRHSPWRK